MKRNTDKFILTPNVKDNDAGDCDHVVNIDPPAEKAAYSFRREWLKDFEWLRYENAMCSMHCIHFKACGMEFAGNSIPPPHSTHFKLESLVKHVEQGFSKSGLRTGREFNPDPLPLDISNALVSLRPPCGTRGTQTHTHTHTHTHTQAHEPVLQWLQTLL